MNSIIPGDEKGRCYICSRRLPTETHHMLHGCRRAMADKYGLTVNLCRECHRALHDKGAYDRDLEEIAQETFEERYNAALWFEVFGKNYRR